MDYSGNIVKLTGAGCPSERMSCGPRGSMVSAQAISEDNYAACRRTRELYVAAHQRACPTAIADLATAIRPRVQAIPTSGFPPSARRAANSELDSSRFAGTFGFRAEDWRVRTREVGKLLLW